MVKFLLLNFPVQAGCCFTSFSWTRSHYTLKWKYVKETVVYVLPSLEGMRLLEENGSNAKETDNESDR